MHLMIDMRAPIEGQRRSLPKPPICHGMYNLKNSGNGLWGAVKEDVRDQSLSKSYLNISSAAASWREDESGDRAAASAGLRAGVGVEGVLAVSTSSYERVPGFGVWDRSMGLRGGAATTETNGDDSSRKEDEEMNVLDSSHSSDSEDLEDSDAGVQVETEAADSVPSATLRRDARYTRKQLRKQTIMDKEQELCLKWLNQYGKRYVPPTPKFLILWDNGNRKFSKADVMRRTAWMGIALGLKSREELPFMRTIVIKDVQCTAITARSPEMARKLLGLHEVGPCKVKIEKDKVKNTVHGVIFDYYDKYKKVSDEAMVGVLSDHGVLKVERFTRGLTKDPTKSFKITFDGLECPESVTTINNDWFMVKPFVQAPLRCYKCQKYDHPSKGCRSKVSVCQRCGEEGHESKTYVGNALVATCENDEKCYHCKGAHEAGNRFCETYKAHRKVNELMVLSKLTKQEAKLRVFGVVRSSRTDAQVVVAGLAERQEVENKTAIDELNAKVDRVLQSPVTLEALNAKLDLVMAQAGLQAAPRTEGENMEEMINKAVHHQVAGLQKELKEVKDDSKRRYDELDTEFKKQRAQLSDLKKENAQLRKDKENVVKQLDQAAEKHRKELEKERAEKDKLQKQVTALLKGRDRSLSPHEEHDSKLPKTSDSRRGNSTSGRSRGKGGGARGGASQPSLSQPTPQPMDTTALKSAKSKAGR